MPTDTQSSLAEKVIMLYQKHGWMIATAESCTGGLIIAALTEIAGSSSVIDRGFITYSNEAKAELLGVPMELIIEHGAVSEPVVRAMVSGALAHSNATTAIAVTGIAGPAGATPDKPVGLVYLAVQSPGRTAIVKRQLYGDQGRSAVRTATVITALEMLADQMPR